MIRPDMVHSIVELAAGIDRDSKSALLPVSDMGAARQCGGGRFMELGRGRTDHLGHRLAANDPALPSQSVGGVFIDFENRVRLRAFRQRSPSA
ncbi:hypothetical protein G6F63_016380 [Rhizopus arrhizus]|nr:hypothetical protein G6F63_016380 [Rhizopus arrhizus]